MDSNKLITFIIPTIGRFSLSKTIESIKKQKIDNWKCIILFDGIKNNIIHNNKDERIKIIELPFRIGSPPNNAGDVRNIGFQFVDTEWIGFVDDDDTISPLFINNLLEEIKENNDMECCVFRMMYKNLSYLPKINDKDIIKNNVGISFCFKKNLFYKIPNLLFSNNSHEDFNFLEKIKNNNIPITISSHINYFVKTDYIPVVKNILNIPRIIVQKNSLSLDNNYDEDNQINNNEIKKDDIFNNLNLNIQDLSTFTFLQNRINQLSNNYKNDNNENENKNENENENEHKHQNIFLKEEVHIVQEDENYNIEEKSYSKLEEINESCAINQSYNIYNIDNNDKYEQNEKNNSINYEYECSNNIFDNISNDNNDEENINHLVKEINNNPDLNFQNYLENNNDRYDKSVFENSTLENLFLYRDEENIQNNENFQSAKNILEELLKSKFVTNEFNDEYNEIIKINNNDFNNIEENKCVDEYNNNYNNCLYVQNNISDDERFIIKKEKNEIDKIIVSNEALQQNRYQIMRLIREEKNKYIKSYQNNLDEQKNLINFIKKENLKKNTTDNKNNIENDEKNDTKKKEEEELIEKKKEEQKKDFIESIEIDNSKVIEFTNYYFNNILHNKKIYIELDGGLGNLLYQIFFSLNISLSSNRNIIFFSKNQNIKLRKDITKYRIFSGIKDYVIHDFKSIESKYDMYTIKNLKYYHEKNLNTDKRINNFLEQNESKDLYMSGYFQSVFYFDLLFNKIKNFLDFSMKTIAEKIMERWKIDNNYQNKKIIAIHIRGTDYLKYPKIYNILNNDYYENALSEFFNDKEHLEFIIFTDDVEYVKNNFNFIKKYKVHFMNNIIKKYNKKNLYSEYYDEIDLFSMSLCDYLVCANSTFSLWAGYFGNHEHILLPCKWFGVKGPDVSIQQFLLKNKKYRLIES